jgi:glycosyltransferase involved in cell wall biosynthesis
MRVRARLDGERMQAFLIEPHADGQISGGYVYNARLAAHSTTLERHAIRPEQLEIGLEKLEPEAASWIIADSLFLTSEHMRVFERRFDHSRHRLAVLLHAFPSFIRRAQDRDALARALPLAPSREELQLLERLDLLIAPGPYIPRLLAECGSRVTSLTCPPGVDPGPAALPHATSDRAVKLLSIGSVTPLKGYLDAAEALGQLGAANFQWTILGHLGVAPAYVQALRRRVLELGLGDRVELAGQRDHAQTLSTLQRSDVLLITSFTENHPLVALEALAARVPIVGYDVGGLPDIVRNDETGVLTPLLDVPRLSAQLDRLIGNAGERQRLAEGCARAARELPSWPESARRFDDALSALSD